MDGTGNNHSMWEGLDLERQISHGFSHVNINFKSLVVWVSFLISVDIRKLVRIHKGRDGWDHCGGDRMWWSKEKKERGTMEQEGLNEVGIGRLKGEYGEE